MKKKVLCVESVFIFLDHSSHTGLIKFMSLKLIVCMIILVLLLCSPKNFILHETHFNYAIVNSIIRDRGGTVVKMLCYKSVGRWFDPS